MLRGAIWACVIPVGLGIIGTLLVGFELSQTDLNRPFVRQVFFTLGPYLAGFIFGPPITAWLACRSLKKVEAADTISLWKTSAVRGLVCASLFHIIWTGFYTILMIAVVANDPPITLQSLDPNYSLTREILVRSLITQLIFWTLITVPASLLSATMFWKITKFPDDTSVF